MSNRMWRIGVLATVLVGLAALDVAAWGPRAQRAICGTAIQVIRRTYVSAFKTYDVNYEEDVLRGADAGPLTLNNSKPFASFEDAVVALKGEIQLLRDVRQYGFGSYFSYRMGMLGALVSDMILPYALDAAPEHAKLREQIEADIDAHLDSYSFSVARPTRKYLSDPDEYFREVRAFYSDGIRMIADDYKNGSAYNGYLKEGGPAFFGRAVEGVADAWNTVLRVEGKPGETQPSGKEITAYLVGEIRYLLVEKKNFGQALKAYDNFARVVGKSPKPYEQVGDLFYAFGTPDGVDRGVREWRLAYDMPGADRRAIGKKLSTHYLKVGGVALTASGKPGASDQDLPDALNAFTQALEFDQTNNVAAAKINETNQAITERRARRELNVNIIASADKVMAQAEKSRLGGDFGNAIATYSQAVGLFQAINDEFADQYKTAKESIKTINKNITDIINEVLDAASDSIDKGDKAVDEHRFADAVAAYDRVPGIVNVIPGDESTTHGKDKKEIIDLAKKKTDECKLSEQRFQEAERARKAAAEAAAKGGKAPQPAPAAKGGAPAPAPAAKGGAPAPAPAAKKNQ